jgi:hypothetical protein
MVVGFLLIIAASARAAFTLKANFGDGQELPSDHRGDEDNVSPPISWSGQPKNTESFVLVVDSSTAATEEGNALKTHWIVYDIPKEVTELREELSGAGASSVSRLGMKEDAGQAPVVCDSAGGPHFAPAALIATSRRHAQTLAISSPLAPG